MKTTRVKMMSDIMCMIAPQAKRRLFKDVERARETLMCKQGIWYLMDENDITKGKALIRGLEDTPYEGCLLLFSFQFPSDYPFSPPKVQFLTSDGSTRFHPNLYVDGKVCLSILGTFAGPSWSGAQSLSSILLSLLGILDKNPLAHEPAYNTGNLYDARHRDYADFVEHQMIKLMIKTIDAFERGEPSHPWKPFASILHEQLPSLKESLAKKVMKHQEHPEQLWGDVMYGMYGRSFWKRCKKETPWILQAGA